MFQHIFEFQFNARVIQPDPLFETFLLIRLENE